MDMIRICTASLQSVSPYSQSRYHKSAKAHENEAHDELEERTWREKCTVDETGNVCIPGFALKMALDKAASRLQMKIPGKGRKTYVDFFKGGILPPDLVPLGIHKDAVESITLMCDSKGKRGATGGSRVPRTFPIIRKWGADVTFHIIDTVITKEAFERHLREAGFFVGIGRFRPENGGTNGRFKVTAVQWSEQNIEQMLAA